jgi:hypothetical protein
MMINFIKDFSMELIILVLFIAVLVFGDFTPRQIEPSILPIDCAHYSAYKLTSVTINPDKSFSCHYEFIHKTSTQ